MDDLVLRENLIANYIKAYNNFDISGMLENLHPEIQFENYSQEKLNLSLSGLKNFREQAEKATALFSVRQQKIIKTSHHDDTTKIEIDYNGVLAVDLPNGLKKGNELKLKGKSVFKFKDNKIILIQDYS